MPVPGYSDSENVCVRPHTHTHTHTHTRLEASQCTGLNGAAIQLDAN